MDSWERAAFARHLAWQRLKSYVFQTLMVVCVLLPLVALAQSIHKELGIGMVSTLLLCLVVYSVVFAFAYKTCIEGTVRFIANVRNRSVCDLSENQQKLAGLVRRLSNLAQLPKPTNLVLYHGLLAEDPVCFTADDLTQCPVIGLRKDLEALLSPKQLEAVLTHEIGHIQGKDLVHRRYLGALFMTHGVSLMSLCFTTILAVFLWNTEVNMIAPVLPIYGFSIIILYLLWHAHSRATEYLADGAVVTLLGWESRADLASALILTETLLRGSSLPTTDWGRTASTHPSIKQRIRALRIDTYALFENLKGK